MPVHDWSLVDARVFRDFHFSWIIEIKRALNRGLLPSGLYALTQRQFADDDEETRLRSKQQYAANSVAIFHENDASLVAILEVISPVNKESRVELRRIAEKACVMLQKRIHVLMIDLIAPKKRTLKGIHPIIWKNMAGEVSESFDPPKNKPMTLASYVAGDLLQAFIEPVGVGDKLIDMPLFLGSDRYVSVPLETIYSAAYAEVPNFYRAILDGSSGT